MLTDLLSSSADASANVTGEWTFKWEDLFVNLKTVRVVAKILHGGTYVVEACWGWVV